MTLSEIPVFSLRFRAVGSCVIAAGMIFADPTASLCQGGDTAVVAAPAVHVESTRPVVSPDGSQILIVDHLMPVDETGQKDEFSGLLRLRLSASEKGTTMVRSREIEAPRVRTVRAPQWLDNRWAVVEYSISRASRGVAYLDGASGRVVQLEIVTATGGRPAVRGEGTVVPAGSLAHFEVLDTLPGGTAKRVSSLTYGQSSVFPIVMPTIPGAGEAATIKADGSSPLDGVLSAMAAWESAKVKWDLPGAAVDQASESVATDKSLMSALACTDKGPRLVLIPLTGKTAAEILDGLGVIALNPSIRLSCQEAQEDPKADGGADESFGDSRHSTEWKGPGKVSIYREKYTSESDQPVRTDLITATIENGEIRLSGREN